jgi:hypothetical protein
VALQEHTLRHRQTEGGRKRERMRHQAHIARGKGERSVERERGKGRWKMKDGEQSRSVEALSGHALLHPAMITHDLK